MVKSLIRIVQGTHEVIVLIDEDFTHIFERERTDNGAQSIIELDNVAVNADAPSLHLAILHHIAQLGFVNLDGLIGFLNLRFVQLLLQIEFALLGNITGGNGQINQFAGIVVDGVQSDFQVFGHISLWNDALRTAPIVGDIIAVEHLVEGEQIEEIHLGEEGITLITIEMTDSSHLCIGIQQPSFRRIEGKSDDGMLENLLVTLRKRFFLLLLLMELSFINQRTDDAQGLGSTLCIFSHTSVVQPAPTGLTTRIVEVPAIVKLQALRLACPEIQNAVDHQV